jgi:hypothetical protein
MLAVSLFLPLQNPCGKARRKTIPSKTRQKPRRGAEAIWSILTGVGTVENRFGAVAKNNQ